MASMIPRRAEAILNQLLAGRKIVIILGARQVGKTTLAQTVLDPERTTMLNLDLAPDLAKLSTLAALDPHEAARTLAAGRPVLVIDEAQRWAEAGRLAKGWYDAGVSTRIVLLGSSSLDLLDKAAEALTGRNEKLMLPPLLFSEILAAQPWHVGSLPSDHFEQGFHAQIRALIEQSLLYGCYPEAVTTARKSAYMTNLANDYLLKDIFQLGLVRAPETVRALLQLLALQVGSEVSHNELAARLSVARPTVERYLQLLQDTFVIFRLSAFSRNPRNEISKKSKYYFWDVGIRNALINNFSALALRADAGALWENFVIAEFAKQNALTGFSRNLYFWRTVDQAEVDLVIEADGVISAYEMKFTATNSTRTPGRAFQRAYAVPVHVVTPANLLSNLAPA